ncbi:MAG: phosphopantetheine-binding protein [Clostridiales bacterium]|jgi:acyl carrier protein|nr:phosphopantetheine-binding protein [Clostridiales bacterium]
MDTIAQKEKRKFVFEDIKGMIADVIGEDVVDILGVTERSEFFRDLQMSSIQIVALAEKVNEAYGDRANINIVEWLSRKPMKAISRLTVGQLADYIANAAD